MVDIKFHKKQFLDIKFINNIDKGNNTIRLIISTLFSFVLFTSIVKAYVINLDAGYEDECFHERVPIGVKLGFSYEVVEGGFYDIDVVVREPNNNILHSEDKSSSGKVTIETKMEGPYEFCFNMKKSSYTPKLIIFDIDRSDTFKHGESETATKPDDETSKLMSMVENLMLSTVSSRHEVRFLTARDRIHRKINQKTNSNLVWWSGLEFILLLVVTLGQVWYLRRFFEIRRKA